MSYIFVAFALAQVTVSGPQFKMPPELPFTMGSPMLAGPSKEWQAARKRGEAMVERLRRLPLREQSLAIEDLIKKVRNPYVISEEFYQVALCRRLFLEAWGGVRGPKHFDNQLRRQRGQADPEYMRVLYLSLTPGNLSAYYWQTGAQLRRIFPQDIDLLRSFVDDAYMNPRDVAQIDLALPLIPKTGYADRRQHGFRAKILGHRSFLSKRRSDVRKAMAEYESFLKRDDLSKPLRDDFTWQLGEVRKRLTDPKYKED